VGAAHAAGRIGEPLFFQHLFAERVWGGNRLGRLFGKHLPEGKTIGESWELSDRPREQTTVLGGRFAGYSLRRLMEELPEALLGPARAARRPQRFPLLVKYIDAGQDLSVQVHPDDDACRRLEIKDRGKAECWVVVYTEPGRECRINRGLKRGVARADLEAALAAGRVEEVLHFFTARVGDVIAIPPGTVHAIGGGIVLAEIQQNSDVTFRLYDYDRPDANGDLRPLHIREALEATCFGGPAAGFFREDMTKDAVGGVARPDGVATVEYFLHGRYFDLERITIPSGQTWRPERWEAAPAVLMCVRGHGHWQEHRLAPGRTVLAPADLPPEAWLIRVDAREPLVLLKSTPTVEA
jgi:mannose-6-phosphate isomerase